MSLCVPFRTLVNNFCMLILPFVEVCAHVLREHVYVLTANSPALWLKIKRKVKTKTQTLIRLLNYEEERDAWPSWQLWGLSISMYVGTILYSLLPSPPFCISSGNLVSLSERAGLSFVCFSCVGVGFE